MQAVKYPTSTTLASITDLGNFATDIDSSRKLLKW